MKKEKIQLMAQPKQLWYGVDNIKIEIDFGEVKIFSSLLFYYSG